MGNRRRYRKKADQFVIAVQLDLNTEGFTYEKWGGEQRCKQGDWIVDNDGDVYSVDAEVFAKTYRKTGNGIYVKTTPIWAEVATNPKRKPDFGPAEPTTSGATVIGARPFLIAYNVYLNTDDVEVAQRIATSIRHIGGGLRYVKALGMLVDGQAQISMNLTNHQVTPLAVAFDTVAAEAEKRGLRVTGAEIVGLVPLDSLLEAGRHYLRKQGRSQGVSEAELLEVAIQSMGLSELYAFDPEQKVIDYRVQQRDGRLVDLSVSGFADLLASDVDNQYTQ